jgi:hypothetical protein
MVEDATKQVHLSKKDMSEFELMQAENKKKMIADKIKYLEALGYRVLLNTSGSNEQRDERMIAILEDNGYTITKEK